MKPKELSIRTGLKERTIRFYEEQGLLRPNMAYRNGRYYREYTEEDAARLTTIASLRRAQFSLEEIRQLLEDDTAASRIYPEYLLRLRSTAAEADTLLRAAEAVTPEKLNGASLAAALSVQVKNLSLPAIDLSPHFGRFDPEPEEVRTKAIAAYRARQNKRKPSPLIWAVMILSLLCACLSVACICFLTTFRQPSAQPLPNGTTAGYIYYTVRENGETHLCRYEEATGSAELLYSSTEFLSFTASEDRVFLSDGKSVYSMNADGSGVYLLAENAGATDSGRMAVCDGMLYLVDRSHDYIRSGSALARIPVSGGKPEALDIATGADFAINNGLLFADFFGEVSVYDLDTKDLTTMTMDVYIGHCRMDDGRFFQIHTDKYSSDASVTWFSYSSEIGFSQLQQFDLPAFTVNSEYWIHGDYFYFLTAQKNSDIRELNARNLLTGETAYLASAGGKMIPSLYFGENGFIFADSSTTPQYLPYPTH